MKRCSYSKTAFYYCSELVTQTYWDICQKLISVIVPSAAKLRNPFKAFFANNFHRFYMYKFAAQMI